MPLDLTVPTNSSYTEQDIELGGITYKFIYKLNERFSPARLYLDIYRGSSPVKTGIKLLEGGFPLDRYILADFSHGILSCVKVGNLNVPLTLGTVGLDSNYTLTYYTFEELFNFLDVADG